jgi:Caudovirus prohead serine protease
MDVKRLSRVEVKDADQGVVSAVFSTFNVVDKDNDVTLPGAFKSGADVVISAYGHQSWEGRLPVGSGKIRQTSSEAILDGQFFLNTSHGRDTFNTVKGLAAQGLGEWSYGYDVLESDKGTFDGKSVRFLKSLDVPEVSPVLVGAGVGTRTLETKSGSGGDSQDPYAVAIKPHEAKTTDRPWDLVSVYTSLDDGDIVKLRGMFAYVSGDPEYKSSYHVLHHHEDGSANARACMIAIAMMNAGKSSVPVKDHRAVWNHLAAHLAEIDIEPPEIGASGALKFVDEAVEVLAGLSSLRTRASDIRAMRAMKGKSSIAPLSVLLLGWVVDELKAYRTLMDSPNEDAAREFMRWIRETMPETEE